MPPHCFKRSLLRSSAYLAADCLAAATLYAGVRALDALPLSLPARALLWVLYTLAQGAVCTGIWVIAHECGHGAFSEVRRAPAPLAPCGTAADVSARARAASSRW